MYSVAIRFTQDIEIERTGFGNEVEVRIGAPRPVDEDFEPILGVGCKVESYDLYPYIAATGYGSDEGSEFPEQAVSGCSAILAKDDDGGSEVISDKAFSSPSRWGIPGVDSEFKFEVDYNSSVMVSWWLDRVVFYRVQVSDADGNLTTFANVPALMEDVESSLFHMWGQTDSWGSEGERILFIPYLKVR